MIFEWHALCNMATSTVDDHGRDAPDPEDRDVSWRMSQEALAEEAMPKVTA